MTRSKKSKKTIAQKLVNVGTTGMAAPAKNFLGNRLVAGLIVLIVPILFVTGIVNVEFENGRPHVSFNKQRAKEVKHNVAEKIQDIRGDEKTLGSQASAALGKLVGHQESGFGSNRQEVQGILHEFNDRVDSYKGEITIEKQPNSWAQLPNFGTTTQPTEVHQGPFSGFRN
jgi:hypothetical protein